MEIHEIPGVETSGRRCDYCKKTFPIIQIGVLLRVNLTEEGQIIFQKYFHNLSCYNKSEKITGLERYINNGEVESIDEIITICSPDQPEPEKERRRKFKTVEEYNQSKKKDLKEDPDIFAIFSTVNPDKDSLSIECSVCKKLKENFVSVEHLRKECYEKIESLDNENEEVKK